jgi:hypothetical protein
VPFGAHPLWARWSSELRVAASKILIKSAMRCVYVDVGSFDGACWSIRFYSNSSFGIADEQGKVTAIKLLMACKKSKLLLSAIVERTHFIDSPYRMAREGF